MFLLILHNLPEFVFFLARELNNRIYRKMLVQKRNPPVHDEPAQRLNWSSGQQRHPMLSSTAFHICSHKIVNARSRREPRALQQIMAM
jgi:hypothetical protein